MVCSHLVSSTLRQRGCFSNHALSSRLSNRLFERYFISYSREHKRVGAHYPSATYFRAKCSVKDSDNGICKKLVFLGTPDVAAKSLEILIEASKTSKLGATNPGSATKESFDIVAVVTQPPAPSGRNKKLAPSPVQIMAETNGLVVLAPEKAKDPDFLEKLESLQPDLCITAAYGNFLPSKFLSIPKFGTLNIHPSLLPKYRGAAPVQRCLENGDPISGVSVVFTVLKMDAGPIVRQVTKQLTGNEKATDLLAEMFVTGTHQLLEALPSVFDGYVKQNLREQDENEATAAKKLSVEDARIDFSTMTANTIHNRCRGFAIWPGIWSTFTVSSDNSVTDSEPQRIKIITTIVINPNPSSEAPTRAVPLVKWKTSDGNGATLDVLKVVCGDGSVLGIVEVQPASKKVMNSKSYINGLRGASLTWTVPTNV